MDVRATKASGQKQRTQLEPRDHRSDEWTYKIIAKSAKQ